VTVWHDDPSSDTVTTAIRHGFIDTRHGQVHYVEAGRGPAVLLLHQTPRSCDEYRDVIPLLANDFRVIAMDTPGFGMSTASPLPWSVEAFADGVIDLTDALGLDTVSLVGHHTGAVIAVEVAARVTGRVDTLVLSGMPFVDADRRRRVAQQPPIDHVERRSDGAHLLDLWRNRAPYYPADRPDLLERLVRDALGVVDVVEEGHLAVNRYRMEERIGVVTAPTLVLCGESDRFSMPDQAAIVAALPRARSATLSGTGVAAVDHVPDRFAAIVRDFLTNPTVGRASSTSLDLEGVHIGNRR